MKKKVNEGFLGDMGAKIKDKANKFANKGYMEGKPKSISDCIKGNGWAVQKTIEKGDNYIVIAVTKDMDMPMTRYMQNPEGMSIEELVEDLNVYLEEKNMTASVAEDAGLNCIRIEKDHNAMNEDVQKIASLVANSARRALKEMNENKMINSLDGRDADERIKENNPDREDDDSDYEEWKKKGKKKSGKKDWKDDQMVAEAIKKISQMLVNEIKNMK